MILEVAILNVRSGLEREFEVAFSQASPIIGSMPGHISHQLQRCLETSTRYVLLVNWNSLEAHTVGDSAAHPNISAGSNCCITSMILFLLSSTMHWSQKMRPKPVVNRTRRFSASTWPMSARRAGYLAC